MGSSSESEEEQDGHLEGIRKSIYYYYYYISGIGMEISFKKKKKKMESLLGWSRKNVQLISQPNSLRCSKNQIH